MIEYYTPIDRAAHALAHLRYSQEKLRDARAYKGTLPPDLIRNHEERVLKALDLYWDAQRKLMEHCLEMFVIEVAHGAEVRFIAEVR